MRIAVGTTLLAALALAAPLPAVAGQTTCRVDDQDWTICDHHLKPGELGPISTITPPGSPRSSRYVDDSDSRRRDDEGPVYLGNRGCVWNYGNGVYGSC